MVRWGKKHSRPVADAGLLLLEIRRCAGDVRHPVDLYARELPRRHAGPARDRTRHDFRAVAAATGEPRLCAAEVCRSVRAAGDPAELPYRGNGPPRARRRDAAGAAFAEVRRAGAVLRL